MMEPMPEDWERAVAVVAHPDDLEYGAAAAVARWTGQGKHVAYVLATEGEAGIEGMAPDVVGPLRVDEERRSAALVGVTDVNFLGHPDGLVEYGVPLRRDLAAALRAAPARRGHHHELRPHVGRGGAGQPLRSPRGRPDHAGRLPGRGQLLAVPRRRADLERVKAVYVAATSDPTHFVDTTATIETGIASLREHKAYLDGLGGDFDPDEFLRNMAGYIGLAAGCEYAVGLRRYPV